MRGLDRRGLAHTWRTADPDRRVDTTVIVVAGFQGMSPQYAPESASREWSGLHVRLAGSPPDVDAVVAEALALDVRDDLG